MGQRLSKTVTPTLLDMPLDIANKIFEKLEHKDLLSSRKVCRGLRRAVDEFGISFDEIAFAMSDETIEMHLDSHIILYTDAHNNGTIVTYREQEKRIKKGNFVEIALKDLKTVLKYISRFYIENNIENRHDIMTSFMEILKSVRCIHAKETLLLKFTFGNAISILPYFDARTLENIELIKTSQVEHFKQITNLDHWKNARKFNIWDSNFDNNQITHLFHFEEFTIGVNEFTVENAVNIRDDLMRRSTFQCCKIYFDKTKSDPVEIARLFKPNYDGWTPCTFEYSNNVFEFLIECSLCGFYFKFFVKKL